jgi:serine/threonine protein kinase
VGSLPDGRVFYAMKLVRGHRLDEHLAKLDSLSEKLRIFQRVCEAVAFAHAHGVLHRDLKPQNIMVGAFTEVLVMDWGAAKILGQNLDELPIHDNHVDPETSRDDLTAHGTVIGTPAFMSPEQALGHIERIDKRSDIFSLGAILFLLLEGRSPEAPTLILEGRSPQTRRDRSSDVTERRFETRVPKPLKAICLKAMAQDPGLRYESALDLSAELDNYMEGKPVSAYKESVIESAARWIDKNRFVFYLIVAYLLMRVIFLAATGR